MTTPRFLAWVRGVFFQGTSDMTQFQKRNFIGVAAGMALAVGLLVAKNVFFHDRVMNYTYAPTPSEAVLVDNGGEGEILIFGSLSCPHCAAQMTEDLPEILDKAPGKVIYRNVIKQEFRATSLFSVMLSCIPSEERGMAVRNAYARQDDLFSMTQSTVFEALLEVSDVPSEDVLRSCMEEVAEGDTEAKIAGMLEAYQEQMRTLKIQATPTIVMDSRRMIGRRSAEDLGL